MNGRAQVPAYGGSVFISYARADDEQPPFEQATLGWVTFFYENLRFELKDVGIHQADLWLDRYKIEPAEEFTKKIEDALARAHIILPILSPNWVQRPWCLQELDSFLKSHTSGEDDIVLVKKLDPPEKDIPAPLRNREGFKFFQIEPTGPRPFYWRGVQDRDAYFAEVRRVAKWIAEKFFTENRQEQAAAARKNQIVYLAAPADEMRDAWRRLANDLDGAGYDVLPEEGRLPDTAANAADAIRAALSKAVLVVHFLGEVGGVTPAGGDENLAKLQLRIAREPGATRASIPRILWAPKWLPDSKAEKRDPFEVVARFGDVSPGEEVYGEEVTDLSQWLRNRLSPPPPPAAQTKAPIRLFVVGAAAEDNAVVIQLANRFQARDVRVRPVYAGSPLPADAQQDDLIFIVWGVAMGSAIEELVARLATARLRLFVLLLPGGDRAAKDMFFVEGVIVEDLDEPPGDRRAARELLERLEIVAVGGTDP